MISKLPHIGTTIFTVMTQLANECGAINLSQGFPDFSVDERLIDAVEKHMRQGSNQYAPMQGVPRLREKISEKVRRLYGAAYDPATEITVTSGATEALFCAITAVVQRGDEAILFEPAYDSYAPAVELCGGRPVYVQLSHPDYAVDWEAVKAAVSPRTRLIILNSPHNPSGAALTAVDLDRLEEIVRGTDMLILSDEVYEHIIFDGLAHQSMALRPELRQRSFVVSSFGKTYHATGWKIGYCLAPMELSREFQKIHQYVTFTSNTAVQMAIADFMEHSDWYAELAGFYRQKRDLFRSLIEASRFTPLPCHGTYFQMVDYSRISDEPDAEFSRRLTREYGVAAIPTSVFYHRKDDRRVLRFCFAKQDETLERAAEILRRI